MLSRPFTFVNVAASVDGKISDESRRQVRISSKEDFMRVDRLRAFSDAIMVGIGTVLSDDPSLTIKHEGLKIERFRNGKAANPLRVVVDSKLRTPVNAKVLDGEAETLIATTELSAKDRRLQLSERAKIEIFGEERVDLRELSHYLYEMGVERLMVEGGGTLISSMLKEKLVDELNIYFGSIIIGGENSPTIVDGRSFDPPLQLELLNFQKLGSGLYTRWKVIYD
ncbi:MAG: 2,5-diamino-6-(ribosylamino)-4(3H)-pyrimidinone 5'-phosphate reductase [Archaeoglobus sp.]|nr:2,5-diamino-6-(ribosylamino)-4(3H)-pyrimidinone 5'-phosphate reductase [Archaeoglobus sp.]